MEKRTKGVVAAGHPQTAWAAIQILEQGGNAFDAAVAALLSTCVNEFCMSSLAGGFFANVLKADGTSLLFDAFCQTPIHKRPIEEVDFYPFTLDFGGTLEDFHIGMGSIGTPGTVAGLFAMHKHLCSLPFEELIQPALEIARKGTIVDSFQEFDYNVLQPMLKVHPESRKLFFREEGSRIVRDGEKIQFPLFADFLEILAKEGEDLFYKGEFAQKVAKDSKEKGGFLTLEDFEQYKAHITKPLGFTYRNHRILTNPLPSIGGSMIAVAMHYLENYKPSIVYSNRDKEHVERLLHVFSKMAATNHRTPEGLAGLLQDNGIISKQVDSKGFTQKRGNTTHFNIMDERGNAVSITSSNGEGAGYLAEGTQVMFNNMLGEAALLPNGFHSWTPNTRLSSMMSPTMVLNDQGKIDLVLGTGGAGRIPFAIMQVIHYFIDHKLPIEQAVHAPRVHLQEGIFNLEPGLMTKGLEKLCTYKEWENKAMYYGGVNSIAQLEKGNLDAVGDFRRNGVVMRCE